MPTVPRIATFGQAIASAFPFEVGAGDIVQKQIVCQIKKVAQAFLEVFLDGFLGTEQEFREKGRRFFREKKINVGLECLKRRG